MSLSKSKCLYSNICLHFFKACCSIGKSQPIFSFACNSNLGTFSSVLDSGPFNCRDEEDVEDSSLTVEDKNSFARREQILVPPVRRRLRGFTRQISPSDFALRVRPCP